MNKEERKFYSGSWKSVKHKEKPNVFIAIFSILVISVIIAGLLFGLAYSIYNLISINKDYDTMCEQSLNLDNYKCNGLYIKQYNEDVECFCKEIKYISQNSYIDLGNNKHFYIQVQP